MNDITSLYQDLIIDHWRHPRHQGPLNSATHTGVGINPICGDEIQIFLHLQQNQIFQLQFTGSGCAIAIASASLMAEQLQGKSLTDALLLFQHFHQMVLGETSEQSLGKLQVFSEIRRYPMRIKCATLAWHTFKAAIDQQLTSVTTE